jgi:hypothetical protein
MGERIPDVSRMVAARATEDWSEAHGVVSVRRRRPGKIRPAILRLFGIPPHFTIHLDTLGSNVWRLIDGKRTVGEIRAELERQHPDEPDLAGRLGIFLGAMVSRGFVKLQ